MFFSMERRFLSVICSPKNEMVPSVGLSSPSKSFRVVVLPAPLGPRKP